MYYRIIWERSRNLSGILPERYVSKEDAEKDCKYEIKSHGGLYHTVIEEQEDDYKDGKVIEKRD